MTNLAHFLWFYYVSPRNHRYTSTNYYSDPLIIRVCRKVIKIFHAVLIGLEFKYRDAENFYCENDAYIFGNKCREEFSNSRAKFENSDTVQK